ncbi:MAG: hypothetical protein IPK82_11125 [Polyangiaceae bacterium]|nr:hypothetical protein [Polyangiaceae bacterium]
MANAERERAAKELAYWHFQAEPELKKIFWIGPNGQDPDPLRFLEIIPGRAGAEHGIEVFVFDAAHDFPYASEVALVTERELKLVAAGVLSLPEGWSLDDVQIFTPSTVDITKSEAVTG